MGLACLALPNDSQRQSLLQEGAEKCLLLFPGTAAVIGCRSEVALAKITACPGSQPQSYSYHPLTIPRSPVQGKSLYPLHPLDAEPCSRTVPPPHHQCCAGLRLPVLPLLLQTVPYHLSHPGESPGVAPGEESFQGILATDLCSHKILLKTPAHSTSQGGVENPLQVLLFFTLQAFPGVHANCHKVQTIANEINYSQPVKGKKFKLFQIMLWLKIYLVQVHFRIFDSI